MTSTAAAIENPVSISAAHLIELSSQCRGITLKPGIISALQAGDYQSAFKGRGMEYDESRLYQAGDDIRNIDWRVTARSGKTHTKLFCEERERPVYLWLDFRDAMFFATHGKYKSVIAAELASLFAWSGNKQGDRVGGIIFTDTELQGIKPQRGKSAVLKFINLIVDHPAWQTRSLDKKREDGLLHSLLNLNRLVHPGSLIILLSDFRGFTDESRSQLVRMRQHNEVIMVHIYDWLETTLPPAGQYRLSNGETELEIDTSNSKLVDRYEQKFTQHQQNLLTMARTYHLNYLPCRTDDDPVTVIRQGLIFR